MAQSTPKYQNSILLNHLLTIQPFRNWTGSLLKRSKRRFSRMSQLLPPKISLIRRLSMKLAILTRMNNIFRISTPKRGCKKAALSCLLEAISKALANWTWWARSWRLTNLALVMKVSPMLQHRSIKFLKWWKDSLKREWCHRLTSKKSCSSDSMKICMTTKSKRIKSTPKSWSNTEAQESSLPIKIQTQRKTKLVVKPSNSSKNKSKTSLSTTQCLKE